MAIGAALVFTGVPTGTVKIAATARSSNTALGANGNVLKCTNTVTTDVVFVRLGTASQTAVTTDVCTAPGETLYLARSDETSDPVDNIGAICEATKTTTIFVTPGWAR